MTYLKLISTLNECAIRDKKNVWHINKVRFMVVNTSKTAWFCVFTQPYAYLPDISGIHCWAHMSSVKRAKLVKWIKAIR